MDCCGLLQLGPTALFVLPFPLYWFFCFFILFYSPPVFLKGFMSAFSAGIRARQLRRRLCFVSQKVSFSRVYTPADDSSANTEVSQASIDSKPGSLGVVGLAGVSFLLVRISEISGGRTFHFVVIPSVYLVVSTLLHFQLWSLSLVSFFAVFRLFNFR
jgi:hypothetical protein